MLKLKQYINNNRQLFLMFFTLTPFLIIYSVAYCNPMLIMAVLPSISNKVIDKVFDVAPYFADKAIAATPYVAYGTGWIVVGSALTLTSIKAAEYSYNWRYLANQTTSNIPVVGWMVSWSASTLQWCYEKLTNTKIEPVEYTYFYPKIASALGDPKFFTKKLIFDLSNQSVKISTDKDLERVVEKTKYEFIDRVEKKTEYREKLVYVPHTVYKDRETLTNLESKLVNLSQIGNELIFLQSNQKSREELIAEIVSLSEHEHAVCLTKSELDKLYNSYHLPGVTEENSYVLAPMKLKQIYFPVQEVEDIRVLFDETRLNVTITKEVFKQKYPTIYLTANTLARTEQGTVKPVYIDLTYIEDRTLFSSTFKLDPFNCFLIEDSGIEWWQKGETYKLLTKMEEVQISTLQLANTELSNMVNALREKVEQEQRLINIETTNQGTQTIDFSINDMFFDEISSYLETQDQTSFIVASQGGQNLPFNELNASNTHAGMEMMKKYNEAKKAKIAKTQEVSVQTETVVHENAEILGINSLNSSVFQNMGALFSAALVWSIAHDFQTLDLVARSLLGFIHIPEYNQAFIAATQMSVVDLQMEYGFTLDDARRAYDSIEYANTLRTTGSLPDDLSSSLSNSNDYLDQTQKSVWSWKDYLLLTSGLIIAGSTLYYMYQSVKVGVPADSIQDISLNVEAWKNSLYDKINKL